MSPITGVDELTASEETMIANQQAGTFANETPSGAINGSNQTFTLAATPSPSASLKLRWNGQWQSLTEDYTLSANVITTLFTPEVSDTLRADYLVDTDT